MRIIKLNGEVVELSVQEYRLLNDEPKMEKVDCPHEDIQPNDWNNHMKKVLSPEVKDYSIKKVKKVHQIGVGRGHGKRQKTASSCKWWSTADRQKLFDNLNKHVSELLKLFPGRGENAIRIQQLKMLRKVRLGEKLDGLHNIRAVRKELNMPKKKPKKFSRALTDSDKINRERNSFTFKRQNYYMKTNGWSREKAYAQASADWKAHKKTLGTNIPASTAHTTILSSDGEFKNFCILVGNQLEYGKTLCRTDIWWKTVSNSEWTDLLTAFQNVKFKIEQELGKTINYKLKLVGEEYQIVFGGKND